MLTRRKKLVALAVALLGTAVLAAAAVALKDELLNEYDLYKLRSGDEGERYSAASRLVERKCLRALPALLATCCSEPVGNGGLPSFTAWRNAVIAVTLPGHGFCVCSSPRLIRQLGPRAIPALLEGLRHGDRRSRYHALQALGRFGREGQPAVPHVERIARDSEASFKAPAEFVLKKLRGTLASDAEYVDVADVDGDGDIDLVWPRAIGPRAKDDGFR